MNADIPVPVSTEPSAPAPQATFEMKPYVVPGVPSATMSTALPVASPAVEPQPMPDVSTSSGPGEKQTTANDLPVDEKTMGLAGVMEEPVHNAGAATDGAGTSKHRVRRPSVAAEKGTTVFPLARVAKIIKVCDVLHC